jgi:TPR repeat protein
VNRRRLGLGLLPALLLAATAPARAAQADAQALYDRALGLLCGRGGRPDPRAAAALLERAAAQGHSGAQGLLGWMAMSGVGMPRDEARAARWLRPAAEAGDSAAQNNLGVLYALGAGVPHDHAQAERWFRAAAARGAEDAERNLQELLRAPGEPARVPPGAAAGRLPAALAAAGCRARRA